MNEQRRSDLELVEQAQRGNRAAFDVLVLRYQHNVMKLVMRYIRDAMEAEDVAQEAFIKAYRALPGFRGDSAFYTWLYRIVTNVAIDSLRRKGFKKTAEFDDEIAATQVEPGSKTVPRPDPMPHQGLEREEIRQRIEHAINKLSPEHRAVIVMKEVEELQYNEIAEVLGCSIGTVMSRLFYARKKLQTLLRDVYENL